MPGLISLGALDGNKMDFMLCVVLQRSADPGKIKGIIRQQINLPVRDAVFRKAAAGRPDADHFFECIIRFAGDAHQGLTGPEVAHKCKGERMRSAGDLRPHKSVFRVKIQRIDLLESVTPDIVVAVAGCAFQTCLSDVGILKRLDDAELVILRKIINFLKALF